MLRPVKDQSRGKIATRYHTSARQVLVIGNNNITKIGSGEVFEHFHEPGSAEDGSSRCIHVFKSFFGAFTIKLDKNAKIRCKTVARWFLLFGSDRASKKHENGWGGEF